MSLSDFSVDIGHDGDGVRCEVCWAYIPSGSLADVVQWAEEHEGECPGPPPPRKKSVYRPPPTLIQTAYEQFVVDALTRPLLFFRNINERGTREP